MDRSGDLIMEFDERLDPFDRVEGGTMIAPLLGIPLLLIGIVWAVLSNIIDKTIKEPYEERQFRKAKEKIMKELEDKRKQIDP